MTFSIRELFGCGWKPRRAGRKRGKCRECDGTAGEFVISIDATPPQTQRNMLRGLFIT